MTAEELAEQVLLVGFAGTDPLGRFVEELRSRQPGGVFVRAENWADAASGTALVAALRAAGRERGPDPAADRRRPGGRATTARLATCPRADPARDRRRRLDRRAPRGGRASGRGAARRRLRPQPVPGRRRRDARQPDRRPGVLRRPGDGTELTAAAVRGCARAGLACAAVHFPGLGAASEDTDRGQATVGLDPETLEARDLGPFATAFSEGDAGGRGSRSPSTSPTTR